MSIAIHIARTNAGKWLAATEASPYFCFEADSKEAVFELAKRAVAFWSASAGAIKDAHLQREQAATIPEIHETDRELICA